MKDFKIKRYDYGRVQKRKRNVRATVLTLVFAVAAVAVGWFAYPPVYDFITNFDVARFQSPPPSQPDSVPAPSAPGSSSSSVPEAGGGEEEADVFPNSAVYLPLDVVKDPRRLEAALAALPAKGVDGVVFDLKDASGLVHYQSGLELVSTNRAQAEGAYSLPQVADQIKKAGLIPVGRLYAFRDRTATAHMYESAVKYMNSPVNWIDDSKANGGKPWLNPNDREAQDYIIALAEEAAQSGLKIVLLDGVQFPEGVSLDLATYGNTGALDKSGILADFLGRARTAAEARGCRIGTTVNLMSAAGLSDIRYGGDVGRLLSAAGCGVVEVMPEQFGNGVTSEALTLSAPALDPYKTVSQALTASEEALLGDEEVTVVAMVQAYTSTLLAPSGNKPYGPQEVRDQVRAAREAGVEKVIYLNPIGDYAALG